MSFFRTPRLCNAKSIQFGGNARALMLAGIERIATAVGVTLGPKGRNVIIRQPNGDPKITKDGVTVARSIEFHDQFEDLGARLIQQVAEKTNTVAGDGTTTATILAWSIFAEGYKSVATGANPMDLKRGIDLAVGVLQADLRAQTRPVTDPAALRSVATISANGEGGLGGLIAEAVGAVGAEGFIAVLDGRTAATGWERHAGWGVERGFPAGGPVAAGLRARVDGPRVAVSAAPLEAVGEAVRLLEAAHAHGRPLVVVAPAFSEAVLRTLAGNDAQGVVRCVAVEVPGVGGEEEELGDVAALCGCGVAGPGAILAVDDVDCLLGSARMVEQTMDSTTIDGAADVADRIHLLQNRLERLVGEAEREKMRERIAKLKRVYAVIRVGGRSEIEISESKDRVIDALNASRNALLGGVVAGGGSALLHASKRLDELLLNDDEMEQDRRMGIQIVRNAVRLPLKMISENAGEEGAVIVENVLEYQDPAMGYDAQNGRYVDMFEAGILDPFQVVNSCIVDAASVAGLMITTEASVCDYTPSMDLE